MRMKAGAVALSWLLAASGAGAEEAPDCDAITKALTSVEGYRVTIPPAAPDQGWCLADGATFRSERPGWPDLSVDRLRLRLTATEVELDLKGLRASPRPSDRDIDDRLRSLIRLQSADLRLQALHDPEAETLSLAGLRLDLSGGTTLELDAEIRGADLSLSSLAAGAVTRATLVWRNDGRLLRPVMDLAGEDLAGAPGDKAVDASRGALATLVGALPASVVDDASRGALEAMVRSLPQGRGKLTLGLASADGIGAARLAVGSLSGDPLSPDALATILEDATITAAWQPGLAP